MNISAFFEDLRIRLGEFGIDDVDIEVSSVPLAKGLVMDYEERWNRSLPTEFRSFLLGHEGRVSFNWYSGDKTRLPDCVLGFLDFGSIEWGIDLVESYTRTLHEARDLIGAVEHQNIVPFCCAGNGDMIAVHCESEQVVYVSFCGGTANGLVLADGFSEYLDRFGRLGFPGPEEWNWLPLVDAGGGYSEVGIEWSELLWGQAEP